jgi:hypothetical protein
MRSCFHKTCFLRGLLALPLSGAGLTFFAAAKKVSKESSFSGSSLSTTTHSHYRLAQPLSVALTKPTGRGARQALTPRKLQQSGMHSVQVRPRFAWTKGQPKTIGSLPLLLMKSRGKPAPQTSPRDVVHLRPSEARTDG